MGPFPAHGPSAGHAEPGGLPGAHEPQGHCTPLAPPLGGPGCGAHNSYGCRGQSKLFDAIRSQCSRARRTRIR